MSPKRWKTPGLFVLAFLLSLAAVSQPAVTATVTQLGAISYKITFTEQYFCVSEPGQLIGYGCLKNGNISYDLRGRVDQIGSVAIRYDLRGRLEKVGDIAVNYDLRERIDKIGDQSISYDLRGRLEKIGNVSISYDFHGRVDKVGTVAISYDLRGRIDKIDDTGGTVFFQPVVAGNQLPL